MTDKATDENGYPLTRIPSLPEELSRDYWQTPPDLNFSGDPRSYLGWLCLSEKREWWIDGEKLQTQLTAERDEYGYYSVHADSSVPSPSYEGLRDSFGKWVYDGINEIKTVSFLLLAQQQANVLDLYKNNCAGILDVPEEFRLAKEYLVPKAGELSDEELRRLEMPYFMTTYANITLSTIDEDGEIYAIDEDEPEEHQPEGVKISATGEIDLEELFRKNDDAETQKIISGLDPDDEEDAEIIEEMEQEKDDEAMEALRTSETLYRGLSEDAAAKLYIGLDDIEVPGQFVAVYRPEFHSMEKFRLEHSEEDDARAVAENDADYLKKLAYAKEGREEPKWLIVGVGVRDVYPITEIGEEGGLEEVTQIMENLEDVYITPIKKTDGMLHYLDNAYDLHFSKWDRHAADIDRVRGFGHAYKPAV